MTIPRLVLTLLASALLSAHLAADVLVVRGDGAGDFTTLTAAVDAAVDGDILLLQDDFSAERVVIDDKALVIVSDAGSAHHVGALVITDLAAGKSAVVRGLEIGPYATGSGGTGALALGGNAGAVLIEDCVVHAAAGLPTNAFRVDGSVAVSLSACDEVAIVRSTLLGGDGVALAGAGFPSVPPVGRGGAGLSTTGSTLSVFASTLIGGQGGPRKNNAPGGVGGTGLAGFESEVWIEGGLAQGGLGGSNCLELGDGCEGGVGVALISPFPFGFDDGLLLRRDAQIEGGAGGPLEPPATGMGDMGDELLGESVDFAGAATLAVEVGPLREGELGTFSVFGPPGANAAWMFAFDFDIQRLGGNKGVLALELPLFGPYLMGTIPGGGEAQFNYVNPSLAGTGLDGLVLAKQGLVLDGDGLRFTGPSTYVNLGTTP
ncbi:MAG: hypothetical protein DHS20C15_30120 [Planctomycetota bacterium]|nr:MAG: hypothetical protein DHS20C15_30120 [Planctomycetota bacterium]